MTSNMPTLSDSAVGGAPRVDPLLHIDAVSAMTGVPVNTLRFWRQKGLGPKSGKIGRRVVWRESVVQAWIAEQLGEAV